jgi:hypothetical protein
MSVIAHCNFQRWKCDQEGKPKRCLNYNRNAAYVEPFRTYLSNICRKHNIKELQKTTILDTATD